MTDITTITSPNRVAPNSSEAEEAVLGSILINPDALLDVEAYLKSDDFFIVRHGWIYEAMQRIKARGEAIDNISVVQDLEDHKQLSTIGGSAYITRLVNNTPTHVHVGTYARLVERMAVRRRLLAAAGKIAQIALEDDSEIGDIVDRSQAALHEASAMSQDDGIEPISGAVERVYDQVVQRHENHGAAVGVPTGLAPLDSLLVGQGLGKSELTLLAARPGMGKTSAMLCIARNVTKLGVYVLFLSMEMSKEALTYRMLSLESEIPSQRIQRGTLADVEWDRFALATDRVSRLPLFLDSSGNLGIEQLKIRARREYREHGLGLLCVDYLQLMEGAEDAENRNVEISQISRGLKQLSVELDIPVLAASQLSRKVEQRADKRPMLSDLRDSGSLEQDADNVFFIYRDEVYNQESDAPGVAEFILAKQRQGETGSARLGWQGTLTRFAETEHINLEGF